MAATCEQRHPATRKHDEREQGSSLVAILSVIATLGILVAITLSLSLGNTPASHPPVVPGTATTSTTTTAPKDAASGASEATLAACQANFSIIESAVQTYRALNGSYPPAGTEWATSTANGGPLMQSWPSAPSFYTITWSGKEVSVIPARGAAAHGSAGSETLKTGCFAA